MGSTPMTFPTKFCPDIKNWVQASGDDMPAGQSYHGIVSVGLKVCCFKDK